jgi:hypothetical protein
VYARKGWEVWRVARPAGKLSGAGCSTHSRPPFAVCAAAAHAVAHGGASNQSEQRLHGRLYRRPPCRRRCAAASTAAAGHVAGGAGEPAFANSAQPAGDTGVATSSARQPSRRRAAAATHERRRVREGQPSSRVRPSLQVLCQFRHMLLWCVPPATAHLALLVGDMGQIHVRLPHSQALSGVAPFPHRRWVAAKRLE